MSKYATPARGQAWKQKSGQIKILLFILAVADGYVMCRFKGCQVWTMPIEELQRDFARMSAFDRKP